MKILLPLLPLILIASMSMQIHAEDNNIVVSENPSSKKVKTRTDARKKKSDIALEKNKNIHSGIKRKPKIELTKDSDKYPGVEWKPNEGDPKPQQDANAYPGVEWTPKK